MSRMRTFNSFSSLASYRFNLNRSVFCGYKIVEFYVSILYTGVVEFSDKLCFGIDHYILRADDVVV